MPAVTSNAFGRGLLSRRHFAAGLAATAAILACRSASVAQPAPAYADGHRILRARPGNATLRGPAAPPTAILGYDGIVPGPLFRIRRGEELRVRLVNELSFPTTIHWHGLRLPNAMDGAPHLTQAPVAPGGAFDYRFTPPDSGTFWYHAHMQSSEQVGRGLHGALIVDEADPVDVDQDVLLVVDDWRIARDGTIAPFGSFHDAAHEGRLGSLVTVNGAPSFDLPVRTSERLRLRIINVANARVMALRLKGHRVQVMAIDGQPAQPFIARDSRVILGPGNRIDLFVDATMPPGSNAALVVELDRDVPLINLRYAADAPARPASREAADALAPNPLPERMDFANALRVDVPVDGGAMSMMMGGGMGGATMRGPFGGGRRDAIWSLAERAGDGHTSAPMFRIARGRTAALALANRTAFAHAMHIHGHHFRLLDRLDDGWKPFWLDTVVVPPGETWRIAFVADNPGKWMIHCHMLEHQESGMAGWFEVG